MSSALPLAGRIALVTGATRGIGHASALGLAQAGAHVIAVGRTQGALEALDDSIRAATGAPATLVPLDLREPDGLDVLASAVHERWGRLDILCHAAALLGTLTPVSHIDRKVWAEVLAVNLTASWRLIQATEPLLKASSAGRAILLTSGRVKRPKAFWGVYAATKAGLEALVETWADELAHTPVRTCLVDPNVMRTAMRAQAYPGEDKASLTPPEAIAPLMVELARPDLEPPARVEFLAWQAAHRAVLPS